MEKDKLLINEERVTINNEELKSDLIDNNIEEITEKDIYRIKARRFIPKQQEISKTKKFFIKFIYLFILILGIIILIWSISYHKRNEKEKETIFIGGNKVTLQGTQVTVPQYGNCVKSNIIFKDNKMLVPDIEGNYTSYDIYSDKDILVASIDINGNIILKDDNSIVAIIPKDEIIEFVEKDRIDKNDNQHIYLKINDKYAKLNSNDLAAYIIIPENVSFEVPNVNAPSVNTPNKVEKPSINVDMSIKVTTPEQINIDNIHVTVPNVNIK